MFFPESDSVGFSFSCLTGAPDLEQFGPCGLLSETDPERIRPIAPGRHGAAGRKKVAEIAPCRWSKYRKKSPSVLGGAVKTLARPLVRILAHGLAPLQAMGEKLQDGLEGKNRHICELGQSALTEAKPRPLTEPTEAKDDVWGRLGELFYFNWFAAVWGKRGGKS